MEASPPIRASGRGGPPYYWRCRSCNARRPEHGSATLTRDPRANQNAEQSRATSRCTLKHRKRHERRGGSVWPVRNSWNRATENLYSAWIETLFDSPLEARTVMAGAACRAARPLAQSPVQSSGSRAKTRWASFIRPDCADLPYFLRGYFAFKMGLPFGYAKCTRAARAARRRGVRCGGTSRRKSRAPSRPRKSSLLRPINNRHRRVCLGCDCVSRPRTPVSAPGAKPSAQRSGESMWGTATAAAGPRTGVLPTI